MRAAMTMNSLVRIDHAWPAVGVQERRQQPKPTEPWQKPGGEDGPRQPDVKRPDNRDLLERMRRVDPNTARRYRQRSGE